jgi:hypothetical protein
MMVRDGILTLLIGCEWGSMKVCVFSGSLEK